MLSGNHSEQSECVAAFLLVRMKPKANGKSKRIGQNTESKRGTNPNSLANLVPPFPKGVSGNPGGRPKLLGESYREWLAKQNANGTTNAQTIAESIGQLAALGEIQAAREIRSATEGDRLTIDDSSITDEDRALRIVALLDEARARRAGQTANGQGSTA